MADGVCDEGDFNLGKDTIPRMTVSIFWKGLIDSKPITYKNYFPPRKRFFLSEMQVKYVEYEITIRDMANVGM